MRMSELDAPAGGGDQVIDYDQLAVHRMDLARDPANRWKILVTKETEPMAENSGQPAAAPIGQTGQESLLQTLLALLTKMQPGFNALAVMKEREVQGLHDITFARGANYASKGEIVVTKQSGPLTPAEIATLATAVAPLLRGMDQVTVPFKAGAFIDPPKDAGDVLTVTKESNSKLSSLEASVNKVLGFFEGEQSLPARLGAVADHLRVTKSSQSNNEPPTRQEPAGGASSDPDNLSEAEVDDILGDTKEGK